MRSPRSHHKLWRSLPTYPQDSKGIFHPSANALRIETMLEMELQKRLKLDVVEEKILLTLMQYEKDRKMVGGPRGDRSRHDHVALR